MSPWTDDPRSRDEPRDAQRQGGGEPKSDGRGEERGERFDQRAHGPADDRQDGDQPRTVASEEEAHRYRTLNRTPDGIGHQEKEPRAK